MTEFWATAMDTLSRKTLLLKTVQILSLGRIVAFETRQQTVTGVPLTPSQMGVDQKLRQLKEYVSTGDSLDGAILSEQMADNIEFSGICLLRDADLSEASLRGADLSETNLGDAALPEGCLSDVDLSEASLRNAALPEAYPSDADLSEANLNEANLSKAAWCRPVGGFPT